MNWRRAVVATVVAAPVIALLAYGFSRDPRAIDTPLPGRPAPTYALEVVAPGEPPLARRVGDTIHSADLLGKVTVINFMASWCLECRTEHRALSETARLYAAAPVQFLGVLYKDQVNAARNWIESMGGQSYPSVNDPRSRMAIDYGLYGVPETFIIDPKGVVAYKHIGAVTDALLRRWIDSLMPRTITPDTGTRAPR